MIKFRGEVQYQFQQSSISITINQLENTDLYQRSGSILIGIYGKLNLGKVYQIASFTLEPLKINYYYPNIKRTLQLKNNVPRGSQILFSAHEMYADGYKYSDHILFKGRTKSDHFVRCKRDTNKNFRIRNKPKQDNIGDILKQGAYSVAMGFLDILKEIGSIGHKN